MGRIGRDGLIGVFVILVIIVALFVIGDNQPQVSDSTIASTASLTATPVPTHSSVPTVVATPTHSSVPTVVATPTPSSVPTAVATPTPNLTLKCAVPDNTDVTALLIELKSCKPISQDTKDLIDLFVELEGFKTDPEFHQVGFGGCCRFNSWLKQAEALRDRAGLDSLTEVGILPGDIILVGQAYMNSAGRSTEHTEWVKRTLEVEAKKTIGLETPLSPIPTADLPSDIVIGEWLEEITATLENRITIFSESGQLSMKWDFSDGSEGEFPLIESKSPIGRSFHIVGGFPGDYYVIDAQGNLQIRGSYGLITTARKVE